MRLQLYSDSLRDFNFILEVYVNAVLLRFYNELPNEIVQTGGRDGR